MTFIPIRHVIAEKSAVISRLDWLYVVASIIVHLKPAENPRVPAGGVFKSKEKNEQVVCNHSDEEDEWKGLGPVGDVETGLAEANVDEEAHAHEEADGRHGSKDGDPEVLDSPVERRTAGRNEPGIRNHDIRTTNWVGLLVWMA